MINWQLLIDKNTAFSEFNIKAQQSFSTIIPQPQTTALDMITNMKTAAVTEVCTDTPMILK